MAGRQTNRRTRPGATDYRLVAVGVVLVLAWVAIGVRLFQVQVVRADELAAMGLDQRLTVKELAAWLPAATAENAYGEDYRPY